MANIRVIWKVFFIFNCIYVSVFCTNIHASPCIEKLVITLSNSCSKTLTLNDLGIQSHSLVAFIRINDSNPANGDILDGLSPVNGWKYGVFSIEGNLICSGSIVTKDYTPPFWNETDSLGWSGYDTLVVWHHDLLNIADNIQSWNDVYSLYFTGIPSMQADSCGGLISILVTDQVERKPCNEFESVLFRHFTFSDTRGNNRQLKQVIYFRKPIFNVDCSFVLPSNSFTDFGPSSLASFGILGTYSGNSSCQKPDTIQIMNCGPKNEKEIINIAKSYYTSDYFLPSGIPSQINLFELNDIYPSRYEIKTFDSCQGNTFSVVIFSFLDPCQGMIINDTICLKFTDNSPPLISPLETNKPILGRIMPTNELTYLDLPVIPVDSLNASCTGSIKLPHGFEFNHLGDIFNWSISDQCAPKNKLDLEFDIQTAWEFLNPFYSNHLEFKNRNYPIIKLSDGSKMFRDIPPGFHRILISAKDECSNVSYDTLYFLIYDKSKPQVKTKDILNVTLPFINQQTDNLPGIFIGEARVYAKDLNEGSYDGCFLDSLYVRRKVTSNQIKYFLEGNLDYDLYSHSGNSNGRVDFEDFEHVSDSIYMTPKGLPYVSFFCTDVGKDVYAELWGVDRIQVLDYTGSKLIFLEPNFNWNQTRILVENHSVPLIKAPGFQNGQNSNNQYYLDGTDKEKIRKLDDSIQSNLLFGTPVIMGGFCQPIVTYHTEKSLSCDTGYIDRVWTLLHIRKTGDTLRQTARQRITIRAIHSFSISVPEDKEATCQTVIQSENEFTWSEQGCDLIGISFKDQNYSPDLRNGNCFKIFRIATFINWCMVPNQLRCEKVDPGEYARILPRKNGYKQTFRFFKGSEGMQLYSGDTKNLDGYPISYFTPIKTASCAGEQTFAWQYTQIITVVDNIPPTILPGNTRKFSLRETDCKANILFSFNCKDDCSNKYFQGRSVQIRKKEDGILVKSFNSFPGYFRSDTCQLELGDFPEGEFTAIITIADACGNTTTGNISFIVEDKSIIPGICVLQLNASLTLDGSESPGVTIHYKDFLQDSDSGIKDCSGTVQYFLLRDTSSFRPQYNSEGFKSVRLNCADLGQELIPCRLYQVDKKDNYNFCKVYVKLNDYSNVCSNQLTNIGGKIRLANGFILSGFQVTLTGTNHYTTTNAEGIFKFSDLNVNKKYTLNITKENQYLEGVSTYDLLLINRHILGIKPITNKYGLVAADVNNSGSITTLDMVLLRKIILQVEKKFPNNTNWHFFDKNQQEIITFYPDKSWVLSEITGVKTGDVSGVEGLK